MFTEAAHLVRLSQNERAGRLPRGQLHLQRGAYVAHFVNHLLQHRLLGRNGCELHQHPQVLVHPHGKQLQPIHAPALSVADKNSCGVCFYPQAGGVQHESFVLVFQEVYALFPKHLMRYTTDEYKTRGVK